MFDLVADVENYPEFLPLCEALEGARAQGAATGANGRRRHDGRVQGVRETFPAG